ncbi:hypothetical protein C8A05DRAFT_19041 [Staphylotrichum tortipilum]|uniref:C2H2-type domain-containing protein n=1 Tax=Staphylotrichum tortipilum TaxID=2831512 RepID=A0AAN6RQF4_9PEZI|nr:hypothetical protein C8A05DRAFT_19041 [Staphylotrichum longicolle]
MGLTTILRGFKVPVTLLDRFFEANGVMPTFNYPPRYDRIISPGNEDIIPAVDPHTALVRARLPPGTSQNQNTRLFMPNCDGMALAAHAYISYAFIHVFVQRQIDVPRELPETPPEGFRELRREILGFVQEGEMEEALGVAGMLPATEGVGTDPAGMLFVIVSDERAFSWKGPFLREADRCCDQCPEEFESYLDFQAHRRDVHGVAWKQTALPNDL